MFAPPERPPDMSLGAIDAGEADAFAKSVLKCTQ
jgi:hypothetical protein